MDPLPDYDDLVWLFEREPLHPEGGPATTSGSGWRGYWPYTMARFSTSGADVEVELAIEPGYQARRLRVAAEGVDLVNPHRRQVRTVGVERVADRDLLRIGLTDRMSGRLAVAEVETRYQPRLVRRPRLTLEVAGTAPAP